MLRPELLTDETLGHLPDELVLFYLKLWLVTDDDGYFDWRPGQIAATLYPYRGDRRRTSQVARWLSSLVGLERVRLLRCGVHGLIPTIPRHRIQGGKQSSLVKVRHEKDCPSRPLRAGRDQSASESLSDSDSESVARARARIPQETMTRQGGFAATLPKR